MTEVEMGESNKERKDGGKREAREDGGWGMVSFSSNWPKSESSGKVEQSRPTALKFITKISQ